MNLPNFQNPRIDPIGHLFQEMACVDVYRLDQVHPVVSGNKWFKLKYYLDEARALGKKTLVTYGGAWSNHIVATAAAAQAYGFSSAGIVRGEPAEPLSPTLVDAAGFGMQLFFQSREDYRKKILPHALTEQYPEPDRYLIGEGGYGPLGAAGAATILDGIRRDYSHILAAVGTGTMAAGLTLRAAPEQQVIGISVLKNNRQLESSIRMLLPEEKKEGCTVLHDFHFGGYARHTPALLEFMNHWYGITCIPSDFVYTGKLFFALDKLLGEKYFPPRSRLLVVHSGGLQGNRSLPKGTLIY